MHEYEYSSMSTITLECNIDHFHDYFNEFPVSPVKATLMEYVCFILVMLLCHYCSNWLLLSHSGCDYNK